MIAEPASVREKIVMAALMADGLREFNLRMANAADRFVMGLHRPVALPQEDLLPRVVCSGHRGPLDERPWWPRAMTTLSRTAASLSAAPKQARSGKQETA